jgi:hypothetical protein
MSSKLPAHDSHKTSPANLSGRLATGKFKNLPAPTAKNQTLMLYHGGSLVGTYNSYKPRPTSALTWRAASNASGATRKDNGFIRAKHTVNEMLHAKGIRLSNDKKYLYGQGNFMDAVKVHYASVWKSKGGVNAPEPHVFYQGMNTWLGSAAGRQFVDGQLANKIRSEIDAGRAGQATTGANKTIDISALAAGEVAFSPKRKSAIFSLGSRSGDYVAPRANARRGGAGNTQVVPETVARQQEIQAFADGVRVGENTEAASSSRSATGRRRAGSASGVQRS